MAKRKARTVAKRPKKAGTRRAKPASVKRPKPKARTARKASSARKAVARRPVKTRKPVAKARPAAKRRIALVKTKQRGGPARGTAKTRPAAERVVQSPPSSLDMVRRGTAARSGRAEMAGVIKNHSGMSSSITAGDPDANVEDAYFTGDEAPGGDNPAPDQEVVDDIGKALGIEYQDNEELRASDKVGERDKHRWELDPASSEDYRNRK